MSELLVLLWTARCLESHMVFLKPAQSPLCQLQLLRSLSPRMSDPVQMSQSRESVSFRLTKQHWISCNHGQSLPGSHWYRLSSREGWHFATLLPSRPTDKPAAWVSQWVWWGHVPVVPFPNPGEITALPGSRIAHGETIAGKEAMHHPFWKSKWSSAMVLCSRSPQSEMGATPVCSLTCYNTAVMSSC